MNMQIPTDSVGSRAILALDAANAFDSLEWDYLWWVLERFEFGPSFIGWVKTLYSEPRAKIKINNEYSVMFQLERGLFAIGMEPLAVMVHMVGEFGRFFRTGYQLGEVGFNGGQPVWQTDTVWNFPAKSSCGAEIFGHLDNERYKSVYQ